MDTMVLCILNTMIVEEIPIKVINYEELYDYFPDNLADTDDSY